MKRTWILAVVVFGMILAGGAAHGAERLMILCGAGFKLPMEEVISSFTRQTGVEVNATYGGAGTLLSQISLSKQGDVFVAPSPDFMEKARSRGHILRESIKGFGYVVPAINVQKGNPKAIRSLRDMARPGIKIALGNPETVFVGMLGVEIIEKGLNPQERDALKKNIVTYGEDFNKLASLLLLKQVDAVIGFSSMSGWYPDKVETVKLNSREIHRIGVGQAAVLSYSKSKPAAERFIGFLASREGQSVFKKYHYFGTVEEANAWIGEKKPVGGEYRLPPEWFRK
ncbi:molybdate ABC transporter substrate-binding protein [Syntrophorhabdus aromaticivorans]|uniref:Molybdate ABC transporter substrate-binding protein n=1 Tax=Syntrophorhabdus aromaticivorans TaxID=328301 RepID=A0A971S246_9BACT|nr:molybdate ABC transporter substrate-binding protein [Syntrophorhabdus aromaticivorans]NLW35897.1 molybdate ABC transporter substrate-binding protein [Syntrophorhabdus aromaticivorans]